VEEISPKSVPAITTTTGDVAEPAEAEVPIAAEVDSEETAAAIVVEEDSEETVEAIAVAVDSEETVVVDTEGTVEETVEEVALAIGMAVIVVAVIVVAGEGGAPDLMEGQIDPSRGVLQEEGENGPR